ncbi:MAG: outer membrane protein, partial [Cohaesibacteraceae bacterium]
MSPKLMTAAAALGVLVGSGSASAADYATLSTHYAWTGFYGGVVTGLAGGQFDNSIPANPGPTDEGGGLTAGVHVGYNHQVSSEWVLGIEADFSIIDIDADSSTIGYFEERWLGTRRGRAGYAFERYLAYVTAGVAFTNG